MKKILSGVFIAIVFVLSFMGLFCLMDGQIFPELEEFKIREFHFIVDKKDKAGRGIIYLYSKSSDSPIYHSAGLEVVHVGDSIFKRSGDVNVFIKRNGKLYTVRELNGI